jgi:hypothetical protein
LVDAAIQGVRQQFAERSLPRLNIFLSYRRADSTIASAIHRFAQCWWDKAMLNPGVDWASDIVMAIEACQLFVLIVRDPLPAESYVWQELRVAIEHKRPIAILSFGTGAEEVLSKCGTLADGIKAGSIWAERPLGRGPRDRLLVSYHPSTPPALLYFPNLYSQLRISSSGSRDGETRETFDTPNAVKLFNFIDRFPESCQLIRPL